MRKNLLSSIALSLTAMMGVASAATVTVTVKDNGANMGVPGTFYWALTNCNPGDTIAFNISGPGAHFLQVPPGGFPLIYQKHGITVDGYSQPGAAANSNPITAANNAQLKIVIDGRNNNGRDMDYFHYDGTPATSVPPINNTAMALDPNPTRAGGDLALLGIYRSTNVTIKGLAFLSDNLAVGLGSGFGSLVSGILVAHDYGLDTTKKDALDYPLGDSRNCHVAGCWFGVNPTNPSPSGVTICYNWLNFPRHAGDDGPAPAGDATRRPQLPNVGVTIGVAPGSSNPRSEFNVFVGGMYHFGGEPLRMRISGNFVGVMPDGVTPYDVGAGAEPFANVWKTFVGASVEFGRYGENYASSPSQGKPMVFGTDGDGVNDADEGNLWGPIGSLVGKASLTSHGPALIHYYRSGNNTFLIAGNRWGIGVDGRRFTNSAFFMSGLYLDDSGDGKSKLIIGSDMASGRSAATIAAQANHFYNNWPVSAFGDPPITDSGIVPFLEYENPNPNNASATTSPNAWVSLRGNVMVGNGLAPINYANGTGSLLNGFTNFFSTYLDTNVAIIPTLNAGSVFPNLSGTFAPGVAPFTNVMIDVYELDPEGWSHGQAFALSELDTAGFPQGNKYLGSFPVPNTGSFNITLPANAGAVTVTANYSQDPAGTPFGRTATSDFSNPGYMLPGGAASVGLTHVVNDVALWYDDTTSRVTNGPVNLAKQKLPGALGNWEPYIDVLGDSTFLVGFNTYADDQSDPPGAVITSGPNTVPPSPFQRFAVGLQPAAGGAAKIGEHYYTDAGAPHRGAVNFRRQNGNPQRVAGDKRYGAANFITAGESSLGQHPSFQSNTRWTSNACYVGANAYVTVQTFSLNSATLAQTPLSKAFDPLYGNFVTATSPVTQTQVSRTGGRPVVLDNGNMVVVTEDRTGYLDPDPQLSSFSIITPSGAVVKSATLVSLGDQWDNVAAFKGGFVVRPAGGLLYFYDNAGNLLGSVNHNTSSGLSFDTGRGDGLRTASDIRSHYVYMAAKSGASVWVAAWDANTRAFVGKAQVDDQEVGFANDRTSLAVDALDRLCVAYIHKPTANFQNQIAARVLQFDGANFTYLTHSFFPFVNYDADGTATTSGDGITGAGPSVAMTTREICIAAKMTINSTNNPAGGADTATETTVYTVISHPAPVAAPRPTITVTKSGSNLNLSWNPEDGLFTVQTTASLSTPTTWSPATAGNVAPPVSISAGTGPLYVRLVR